MKIIIEVECGCVTGVYCDSKTPPEVTLIDLDARESGDKDRCQIGVQQIEAMEDTQDDSICQECGGRGACSSEHVCQ